MLVVGYSALVWQNNRASPPPTRQQIAASWEKSVAWLSANRQDALQNRTPSLWWMIGESAKLSGDGRLQLLFGEYRAAMNVADPNSIWQTFFVPERYWGANFPQQSYANYADYQQLFPIGGGSYLGFNEKLLGIDNLQGNLHATAQGIWLLSLLRQEANSQALARR
jgi:hypothetical protein